MSPSDSWAALAVTQVNGVSLPSEWGVVLLSPKTSSENPGSCGSGVVPL